MKYRALFLDLDGTTIPNSSNSVPSEKVTQAIAKARDYVHICVVTGRPLHYVQYILNHLKLSGLCILDQGAQIYDPVKKEMIREFHLNRSLISTLYKVLQGVGEPIYIFDGKNDILYNGKTVPSTTMSMYIQNTTLDKADTVIKQIEKIPHVAVHKMASWRGNNISIEVTHEQATKLHGIVEVAKILGVKSHELIGVGDSYNDFPLLMACGLKIAMGNAVPELKAIADFIAPTVEEDGVATVIEKFILSS